MPTLSEALKAEKAKGSDLERLLLFNLKVAKLPAPELEYRFHPVRRWRFDMAWPTLMIAVEVEGGSWIGGAHNRGPKFEKDCEKYGEAVIAGWKILRFTNHMIEDGRAVDMLRRLLP